MTIQLYFLSFHLLPTVLCPSPLLIFRSPFLYFLLLTLSVTIFVSFFLSTQFPRSSWRTKFLLLSLLLLLLQWMPCSVYGKGLRHISNESCMLLLQWMLFGFTATRLMPPSHNRFSQANNIAH